MTFRYKDYAHEGRQRTMTLAAAEFIRRFLLHVLPKGFMRIRHYGYLANRHRRQKLAICRRLLGVPPAPDSVEPTADPQLAPLPAEHEAGSRCPVCRTGRIHVIERFPRCAPRLLPARLPPVAPVLFPDSS